MNIRECFFGPTYWSAKNFLIKTEFYSSNALHELQANYLTQLLLYAQKHIPFYTNISITDKKYSLAEVLKSLQSCALIDKKIISQNIDTIRHGPTIRGVKANTGGSTGTPFIFYLERFISREREKAFLFWQWSRLGYVPGDKIFNLRGTIPDEGRFIKHNRFFNTYSASSLNLTASRVQLYIDSINKLKPAFLHGYPSTIYLLASLMADANLTIDCELNGIFCGSEKLFPYQRKKIESVFQCPIISWYGHSEYQVLAGTCEHSSALHLYPQYGYTELIPTGRKHTNGKDIFEIVATGFNNRYMPLIRYRTKDYTTLADNQRCKCGRNYVLLDEVLGREQEFVVDNNGNLLSITALIYGQHFFAFEAIDSFAIVQKNIGELTILIKPISANKEKEASQLAGQLKNIINDKFTIQYKITNKELRTAIGKKKTVIQHLDISNFIELDT